METFADVYKEWEKAERKSKKRIFAGRGKSLGFSSDEALRGACRRHFAKTKSKEYDKRAVLLSPAKVLVFDVETSLRLAFTFGVWEQNISYNAIVEDTHILSWAAKWLFEDEVLSNVLTSGEAVDHNDERIVTSMWRLLDKADIVIAHNGKKFDVKRLNTRFLVHGLQPPSHYHVIDTLTVARSTFAFTSNKLGSINEFLNLPVKRPAGFDLWKRCFYGDVEALTEMVEYNENDVTILEEAYLKLRPWIKNHPNVALYVDCEDEMCRNCGGTDLRWKGHSTTSLGKYRSFRCGGCGAIGSSKHNVLTKKKRKSLTK